MITEKIKKYINVEKNTEILNNDQLSAEINSEIVTIDNSITERNTIKM